MGIANIVKAKLCTSNYKQLPKLEQYLWTPISISVGKPKGWHGLSLDQLAPTWGMLKMSRGDYDKAYMEILGNLDPLQILAKLPYRSALLCWEEPGVGCHRRIVAQWIEHYVKGQVVPEYGIARDHTPRYQDTLHKREKEVA